MEYYINMIFFKRKYILILNLNIELCLYDGSNERKKNNIILQI